MSTVDELGEDKLTSLFAEWLSSASGRPSPIGDDVAVLPSPESGLDQLYTSDSVMEGIHFLKGVSAEKIARKAINRCISDIAAMGGRPKHLLLNLSLPGDTPVEWVKEFICTAGEAANAFGADVVGGDLVRFEKIQVHVFASGVVEKGCAILRSGAKPNDPLFVTGRLGGSLSGHHLDFTPRVEEAQWLRDHVRVTAMMDLSDGLAADLLRLLSASSAGAEVHLPMLPLSDAVKDSDWQAALFDGEDYELLFSIKPAEDETWLKRFQETFQCGVTRIGRIVEKSKGLSWLGEQGAKVQISRSGYQHFSR